MKKTFCLSHGYLRGQSNQYIFLHETKTQNWEYQLPPSLNCQCFKFTSNNVIDKWLANLCSNNSRLNLLRLNGALNY